MQGPGIRGEGGDEHLPGLHLLGLLPRLLQHDQLRRHCPDTINPRRQGLHAGAAHVLRCGGRWLRRLLFEAGH